MSRRCRLAAPLLALVAVLSVAAAAPEAVAQASASSALINQQLDKQVKLQLEGNLPDVMTQITKQTAVPIDAQPEVWELLPWGRETTVTAKIENQTLRDALEVITKRLGLRYVLKEEAIELQPMPALRRLGRKSTLSELEALTALGAAPLGLNADKTDLKTLLETVSQKLAGATKDAFALENRTATSGNPIAPNVPVAVARNATLLDALEAVAAQTPATWYPWGKTVVALPKQDQVRRQLSKEVTLRHEGTDVAQVLSELSMRSGVPFRYEPGTFQEIAPQSRSIRLVLNATILDALEAICGLTGLGYQVKEDEVYVWNTQSTAAGGAPRDRTLAMLLIPETGMQIFIRESDCPPDVKEFIDAQKKKNYDAVRKLMAEQGFKPSRPATGDAATRPAAVPPAKGGAPVPQAPKAQEPPGKDL
jgi:hypothetical protein